MTPDDTFNSCKRQRDYSDCNRSPQFLPPSPLELGRTWMRIPYSLKIAEIAISLWNLFCNNWISMGTKLGAWIYDWEVCDWPFWVLAWGFFFLLRLSTDRRWLEYNFVFARNVDLYCRDDLHSPDRLYQLLPTTGFVQKQLRNLQDMDGNAKIEAFPVTGFSKPEDDGFLSFSGPGSWYDLRKNEWGSVIALKKARLIVGKFVAVDKPWIAWSWDMVGCYFATGCPRRTPISVSLASTANIHGTYSGYHPWEMVCLASQPTSTNRTLC